MVIPLDQQPFGLHSKKKLLQNYEWFGSQPHYPGPVKFALALCTKAYLVNLSVINNWGGDIKSLKCLRSL